MDDKELYRLILGIDSPWEIKDIKLDVENSRIDIYVEYSLKIGSCPECKKENKIHDLTLTRIWRHLDSCQLKTFIHAKQPRMKCQEHGVKTLTPSWTKPNSRFTLFFETLVIKFLQLIKCQKRTAVLLRISENEIRQIKKNAVERGLKRRKIKVTGHLGIDEKSIENGHNYASIIYDMIGSTVIDLCESRKKKSVKELIKKLFTKEQMKEVKYFTVDMWEAFILAIGDMFPNCKIVHDKFHIAGYLNKAVDKTRRSEHKKLLKEDDKSLSKSKCLFLKNEENMTEKQKIRFSKVRDANFETSKVWALKETFKEFFKFKKLGDADKFFKSWCREVKKLGNMFLIKVCDMMKSHYKNIRTYIKKNITNALAESLNAKIQEIKTIARGFMGFKNFRINVLFHLGNLDLYPKNNSK